MLKSLLESGYGKEEKFNCAEKILYGANDVYNLGLNRESLKLSAGFGGGMGIEGTCGALTASVMVLSKIFVDNTAHDSKKINEITKDMLNSYKEKMGSIECKPLKKDHKTLFSGCNKVILAAAENLDDIIKNNS